MKTLVKAALLGALVCQPAQSMNRMRMSNQQKNETLLIVGAAAAVTAIGIIFYKMHIKSSLAQANASVSEFKLILNNKLTPPISNNNIDQHYNYNTIQDHYNSCKVDKATIENILKELKTDIRSWLGYTEYNSTAAGLLVKQFEEKLTILENTLNHIEQNIIFPQELEYAYIDYRTAFENLLFRAGTHLLDQQITDEYFAKNPDYPHIECLKAIDAALNDLIKKQSKIIRVHYLQQHSIDLRAGLQNIKSSIVNSSSYKEERKNFAAQERYEQESKEKKAHEDRLARIEQQKAQALETRATTEQQRVALELEKVKIERERLEHEKNTNNNNNNSSEYYPSSLRRRKTHQGNEA